MRGFKQYVGGWQCSLLLLPLALLNLLHGGTSLVPTNVFSCHRAVPSNTQTCSLVPRSADLLVNSRPSSVLALVDIRVAPDTEPSHAEPRHLAGRRRDGVACFAKRNGGDGKKKPKKAKLEAKAAAEQQKLPEPEAQRITNQNFGMSMKTQLKLVKAFKKMEEKSSRTVVRTKFRREKETVEERNAKKMPETLSNIWSGNFLPPVFLVDGYNVIGQWTKLKKKRDKGNMLGAREALQEEVAQFAHYRGCQCTIIYDAIGNKFGPPITAAELEKTGIEIVFVRDESADSYIEARTAELKAMKAAGDVDPPEVYICSSDNAIRSISSGHGARTMSSSMFVQEMKRARKEYEGSLLDENHLSRAGGMVEDRIGKEAADKLYAMMEQMEGRRIRPPEPGGEEAK